eukprot:scaffold257928_cov32-Tisochrysis_lutea.AAC.3
MVTHTISITSTQRSLRSSGTAWEKEMQCTKGQKRQDERRASRRKGGRQGGLRLGRALGRWYDM